MEPTVGEISGFRCGRQEIHTKFPTTPLRKGLVKVKEMQGYFTLEMVKALHLTPLTYKNLNPPKDEQRCPKCQAPMQLIVRSKGDIEAGIPPKTGYTCNRGGTGCQNAKAKKYINAQKVKKFLSNAPPKAKKVIGVQLEGHMIRA